jgi:hypothetical protein
MHALMYVAALLLLVAIIWACVRRPWATAATAATAATGSSELGAAPTATLADAKVRLKGLRDAFGDFA